MVNDKEPIMPRIREMGIGDVAYYPIDRYNSVRTAVYAGLAPERADGKKWTINVDLAGKSVKVERIS